MPAYIKWPAYIGNALIAFVSLFAFQRGPVAVGVGLLGLSALNLYLVWKLDMSFREESWLEAELRKAKLREEILAVNRRLSDSAVGQDIPPA